jgi:hypothetical protein
MIAGLVVETPRGPELPRRSQIRHGRHPRENFAPLARGAGGPGPGCPGAFPLLRAHYISGMGWATHYFDPRLNRNEVTRSCATKEDALRLACDLMRRECRVQFVQGPGDEKVHAVEITRWCRGHPSRDRRPPLK